MELSLIALIDLAAVVLCLLSGFVLIHYGWKANPANQPLAIGQLCMAMAIFVTFSNVSQLIYHWPYLYRTGQAFVLIFIPMPFLYLDFHVRQRKWSRYDLLHAIPVLIYLADYWHVFILSNAEKIQMMRPEIEDLDLLAQYTQSKYFGKGFHEKFRTILFSGYWIAQVYLFSKWRKSETAANKNYKPWRRWITVFLVFQFFMFAPFYFSFLGFEIFTSYHATNSFVVIWILVTSISLFFFPSQLYGISPSGIKDEAIQPPASKDPVYVDPKLGEVMVSLVQKMDDGKFFLKRGYSINDFSRDTDTPVYQISKCLNHFTELGFVDFVNQKRIDYCVSKLQAGQWQNFTMEAIAAECGFSNRNSFTRAFKKFRGMAPSEFKDVNPGTAER